MSKGDAVPAPARKATTPLEAGAVRIICNICKKAGVTTIGTKAANGSVFGMTRHFDVKHPGAKWDVSEA